MMNSVALHPTPVEQSQHKPRQLSVTYKQALGLSLALLAATLALYFPVIHHPFTNIDDQGYIYQNLHVQDGLSWPTIKWALLTFDDNNWHPITWFSHALDCQMFGINPAGHHMMNALWHSIDAVGLFWVLLLATGYLGRSFMVAALFAVHPINVESVAWMAERKTLVSTFFFLLALGAYRWYARQPGFVRYTVVALLFVLGLMAKPQIITLPCVLLLWDYWPLQRMKTPWPEPPAVAPPSTFPRKSLFWLIKEKIPLLIICAASALITMKAQRVGRPQHWPYSASIRLGNAIVAYVRYIGKAFWPSHLAIMYLHPGYSLKYWQVAAAALVLLAITVLVIVGRRYRYLLVGWFWFLGTLVPTIGLMQVGRQALADRYAYQSFLGLFILICWGAADWATRKHWPRAVLPTASIAILLGLAVIAHRQIGYWSDNLTLWSHAAQVTTDNWVAEDMVAGILLTTGHRDEAIAHYYVVAALNPTDSGSNLAIAIYEQGRGHLQEAIRRYKLALIEMDDPLEQAKLYQNLSIAYRDAGQIPESAEAFSRMKKLRRTH
jgi:protein O-mannosyl-transferase